MSIELSHVTKTIRGARVIEDVTMSIPDGALVGFAGVNGSGKTMVMRMIAGLVRPTSGEIVIDGLRLGRDISFPPSIGLLIESPAFLPNRSGLANLEILASIRGVAASGDLRRCLADVGLDPDDARHASKYSLGMKQRLGVAMALAERPSILVLDEPFNALDEHGVDLVKGLIERERDRGATIILACHDPALLTGLAQVIYGFSEGRVMTEREGCAR